MSPTLIPSNSPPTQRIASPPCRRSPQHLELHLGEGCQLAADSSAAFHRLGRLRGLTLRGGVLTPAAAQLLLRALAAACPLLEELRILPEAVCGLGDDEVALLAELTGLRVRRDEEEGRASGEEGVGREALLGVWGCPPSASMGRRAAV